jgi:MOSC domain-containing protein YiiM
VITKLTFAEVADVFASVTAEAFNLPEGEVPAPQGERLVAIMNDWLATRNWRLAYVRDPQTFAWPGSWIALAADERSPSGWRPILMFGDPSGPLRDPLDSGQDLQIVHGLLPAPLDRRMFTADMSAVDRAEVQVGHVVALMTAPQAAAHAVARKTVTARPGGIDGDRYQDQTGTFSTNPRRVGQDITFIEAEALAELRARGVTLAPEQARRNVVTSGIDLDTLIGRRFRVGEVICLGQRRCEPCAHLERLTEVGTLRGLVHRGGLRADIVQAGTITLGDNVHLDSE